MRSVPQVGRCRAIGDLVRFRSVAVVLARSSELRPRRPGETGGGGGRRSDAGAEVVIL